MQGAVESADGSGLVIRDAPVDHLPVPQDVVDRHQPTGPQQL